MWVQSDAMRTENVEGRVVWPTPRLLDLFQAGSHREKLSVMP